ncbi:uncharacterized protein Z519_08136 [Cladophialophora bantiana CBS 173.52]|uniref:BPL/LPL catalytic domain-containing protein n=1 Tax=Cladophialophora bantiana (strain ATCC 10958 / CBS 173.52 / CDC B-1940 / NIH 8579) TaxID=1442370 RepID=A0A0D2HKE1_CLAB1|nr:uncharacterized protein Z519_08136 [Cladophialophora bantiana CBS 173.52]KIW91240.1 hypothetical protein Z519_08136 [Cladophialophora bantiana CBS 173.52]
MRLAHLHIPGLISYSHSLRLQTAILERYFQHKDWLRSVGREAAGPRGRREGEAASNARVPVLDGKDRGPTGQPAKSIFDRSASHHAAGEDDDAAEARTWLASSISKPRHDRDHDRPGSSSLGAGNGSCTTNSATIALRNTSSPSCLDSSSSSHTLAHIHTPPDPVLLTFSTPPTYTVGRRHLLTNPISTDQQSLLSANGLATFHASPRGGLLTYHAPGQLTGYVIVDLRRFAISARCWVRLLEESVMRTCGRWGVRAGRTDDPGVWVLDQEEDKRGSSSTPAAKPSAPSDRKICAIGVQVSRGVTSHGIGLNVYDAPLPSASPSSGLYDFIPTQLSSPSYDPSTRGYLSWGFSRIVACGLEGKSVTWLTREMSRSYPPSGSTGHGTSSRPFTGEPPGRGARCSDDDQARLAAEPIPMESVADVFAREIVHGLNAMKAEGRETVHGVYSIRETDLL